ncbi:MAG: ABC transporter substrate-binding protein, partial [Acidimicrobiales bacterium]
AACGSSGSDGTATGGDGATAEGPGTSISTPEAQGDPVSGGTATIIHQANPSSLDPVTGGSGGDHVSLYPLYDRLINFEPATLEALPGLATAWDYPDPRTLVLTLQEGVTFHDGTPFDAAAVVTNLERAVSADGSTVKADVSMIESVEATGDLEVTIHMNRDDASLLLILADRPGMMVSPAAIEAYGDDLSRNPVGTGPFRFVEWLPNDRLVMEKNQDYWQDGLPYLDGLTFRYINDQQTAVNALLAGEADIELRVSPTDVENLEANPSLVVVQNPSLFTDLCYFNFSRPPFDNPDARAAAAYAINRDALNQLYVFGTAEPANEIYPPGYWAYAEAREGYFAFDQDKARQLLADAGYGDGVTITAVAYDAAGQARKNEIIQAQLAEVGIDMTFELMEVGAATSTFFEDLTYDLYCAAWTGRPDPSQTALSVFGADAFYNAGHYGAPGMAEALDAAGASTDQDERAGAFEDVIRISQEDALVLPLIHQADIIAYYPRIGGVTPNLYGKPDLSFIWNQEG